MITEDQLRIYTNLLKYTQDGEVFYAADQVFKGVKYRIFSYRLGAYTPFMQPDALEGRGIMFELDEGDQPVRLAARTMHKFFNLNENPSTMNLNLAQDNIRLVMNKVDGSLISTYLDHEDQLQVKSKTSLGSDQVRMAWEVLNRNVYLKDLLADMTHAGWTVNLEYTGPDNRIVIGYEKPELRILNARKRDTGEYLFALDEKDANYMVEHFAPDYNLKSLDDATGFEGVVVVLKSGEWFKAKTPWYAALHHTKDSINSKRRLFECIVMETSDDLKAMFFDDPLAMKTIQEMEDLVIPKFDHFVAVVEKFHAANKDLDRKSYAIKGQQDLQREVFSLAMSKYLGKEVNFKEWAVKHIELFGVKDEVVEVEE